MFLNNLTQNGATHYRVSPLRYRGATKVRKVAHPVNDARFAFELSQFVLTHATSVRSFSVTGNFAIPSSDLVLVCNTPTVVEGQKRLRESGQAHIV